MSRLTKKENNIYTFTHTDEDRQFVVYDLCNKLGKLEDLEDELGCPLDVVFKALIKGVYIKDLPKGYDHRKVTLNYLIKGGLLYFRPSVPFNNKLFLKDYKKTWYLKEDLSE